MQRGTCKIRVSLFNAAYTGARRTDAAFTPFKTLVTSREWGGSLGIISRGVSDVKHCFSSRAGFYFTGVYFFIIAIDCPICLMYVSACMLYFAMKHGNQLTQLTWNHLKNYRKWFYTVQQKHMKKKKKNSYCRGTNGKTHSPIKSIVGGEDYSKRNI